MAFQTHVACAAGDVAKHVDDGDAGLCGAAFSPGGDDDRREECGEFLGYPATGRCISWHGNTILRMMQGKIVERWTYQDSDSLVKRLSGDTTAASRNVLETLLALDYL